MLSNIFFQLQFLFSTLYCVAICIGVGGFVFLIDHSRVRTLSLGILGAYGLLGVGAISLMINFFLPLNEYYFFFLSIIALCGLFFVSKKYVNHNIKKETIILVITVIAYWLLGLRRVLPSDTGLYHIPVIHWMQVSSLPVGLGNIHSSFGIWNFWFSVCGGMNAGNVIPLTVYSMNIVLVGFASIDFYQWIKTKTNPAHYFSIAILFFISLLDSWYFSGGQKSPNADFAGAIFAIWAFSYFLQRSNELENWVNPTILLSGLAILTKLNQAPIFVLILIAIYYSYRKSWKSISFLTIGLIALAAIALISKTFIATGCLVFPVSKTCFPVSWSVGINEVENTYSWVVRWARWPDGPAEVVLHTWGWLSHWWDGNKNIKIIFCTKWIFTVFMVLKIFVNKKLPKIDITALLIALLGIGYWFMSAPDIRFGFGYFIVVFAIFSGSFFQAFFEKPQLLFLKKWVMVVMLTSIATTIIGQVWRADDLGVNTLKVTQPEYKIMKNVVGQDVYVPQNNECWRLPVPCTPYFEPNVIQSRYWLWTVFKKQL